MVASAAVDPYRPKKPIPVACNVVIEIRVTKVQPPRPTALPRQQAQPAERWSATESTTAADVRRQRRIEAARFVAASVVCETVPTEVIGMPSVVMPVVSGLRMLGRTPSGV